MRLLEKDPGARYPSAAAVIEALSKIEEREKLRVDGAFLPVLTVINADVRREGRRTRYQIRLEATNEGTAEANNWCGLTLHFPFLSDRTRFAARDIRAWGSGDPFMRFPGDLVWGFAEDGKAGRISRQASNGRIRGSEMEPRRTVPS